MLVGTLLAAMAAMATTTTVVSAAPIAVIVAPNSMVATTLDARRHGKGINNKEHGPEGFKLGNFCNPDLKDCPEGKACADVNLGGVPDFKCVEV
jgi:hypothetical protein